MGEKKLSAVLVHVDGTKAAAGRVAFAGALADDFGAQLIGVASGQMAIPVEWRASEANEPAGFLVEQARAGDVVVVGRPAKDDAEDVMLGVAASDIVLGVGRPVLVVPPGVERMSGKRVVVAWKDTREARRAVIDALPFLKAAEEVFIAGAGDETPLATVQDVASYLARYGIVAKPVVEALTDGRPATALLRIAQRVNADLIVTGAFGHSRMRQWVFGGVTRDLLDHAGIPVLFVH